MTACPSPAPHLLDNANTNTKRAKTNTNTNSDANTITAKKFDMIVCPSPAAGASHFG